MGAPMPILPDDPTARLLALEVGALTLQRELAEAVLRVVQGQDGEEAVLDLAFVCSHQAALLVCMAEEMRRRGG